MFVLPRLSKCLQSTSIVVPTRTTVAQLHRLAGAACGVAVKLFPVGKGAKPLRTAKNVGDIGTDTFLALPDDEDDEDESDGSIMSFAESDVSDDDLGSSDSSDSDIDSDSMDLAMPPHRRVKSVPQVGDAEGSSAGSFISEGDSDTSSSTSSSGRDSDVTTDSEDAYFTQQLPHKVKPRKRSRPMPNSRSPSDARRKHKRSRM